MLFAMPYTLYIITGAWESVKFVCAYVISTHSVYFDLFVSWYMTAHCNEFTSASLCKIIVISEQIEIQNAI